MALNGSFTIDGRRSRFEVSGTSSVHPIHIRSREVTGELAFSDGIGTGRLVIPVKTLHGETPLHDMQLRRTINPRRYPSIEANVRRLSSGDAEGDITFFGTTFAADGEVTVTRDGDELFIEGAARFDVRDFGLAPPNVLGVRVHPEVVVRVDLVAVRS